MYRRYFIYLFLGAGAVFGVFLLQIVSAIFFNFDTSQISLESWATQIVFYLMIWLSFVFFLTLFLKDNEFSRKKLNIYRVRFLTKFAIVLSFIGLGLIVLDRVMYREVDFFNQSFVEIRSMLGNAETSGISSIYSFLGNIFQYSYYFSFLALLYYKSEVFHRVKYFWISIFILIFCGSYILGGRSIFLILLASYISVCIARIISGKDSIYLYLSIKKILSYFLLILIFIFLVAYVFYERGLATGVSMHEYYVSVADHLGVPLDDSHDEPYGEVGSLLGMMFLYLDHQLWIFESISKSQGDGSVNFSTFLSLFEKIFDFQFKDHQYSGYFVSVPGAVLYDFGWVALFVFPILVGLVLALAFWFIRNGRNSFFSILFFVIFYFYVLMAPVIVSWNLVVLIFMVFTSLLFGILMKVRLGFN